ncbi:YeeE/YedE family protein [Undibacterium baiyunense]|uniref:YeeE/YedE family protein n=1 Tax=Undibacterium baiyunense TaxID=2828731 RepID=A0A941DCG3_9BURK|nr:YeeE/YedE thiosulfate transporter family protein [Undibacterium baiyunense]MBR7746154.1 YeeE/YedE family protein [Undibacterium baiyunense]
MHIAWEQFTPFTAISGGLLIGLASVLLMAGIGRIAGVTGILAGIFTGLFQPNKSEWSWRLAFILGLAVSPFLYSLFAELPAIDMQLDWSAILFAGLIVGFGTRLGSGCTSGHGVCGISRLSPRSIIATIVFMAAGFATVALIRHIL